MTVMGKKANFNFNLPVKKYKKVYEKKKKST